MSEFLFQYHKVNPTTWVYLSSLLMLGLYFKFGRFWSVRNLDLVMLILLAPGLLMAQYGGEAAVKARRLAVIEQQTLGDELAPPGALGEQPSVRWGPGVAETVPELPPPVAAGTSQRDPSPSVLGATDEAPEAGGPPLTRVRSLLQTSRDIERLGYLWLFVVGALLLLRLLLDPTMVRRPLLEPNLSSGGLTFLGCSMFVFLMANVGTSEPLRLEALDEVALRELGPAGAPVEDAGGAIRRGPGFAPLNQIPAIPTNPLVPEGAATYLTKRSSLVAAKLIAILSHLAVVLGIVAIGYWHFGNTKTGIGVATLYLMLPYTAQMTGHIDHVIPAALLVWATLCYRRPLVSGIFMGLATSVIYYPLFLLPLWISFYWPKGLIRFLAGVLIAMLLMCIALYFTPEASYWENLQQMFGLWLPVQEGLEGIWKLGWNPIYRIPVLAAFVALCGTLAIWPAQKNLGTLLSCSAAVMVAAQFWHGYGGGLYIGWYLPLLLLTIFRPNLEDRVALAVLGEGWLPRRSAGAANGVKAS